MKFRLAERGDGTACVEHGIWYEAKPIHVTVPGIEETQWSNARANNKYPMHRAMLEEEAGRWPEGAD